MVTFTTKAFSALPDADEMRSNGCPKEALILFNGSETIQLEAVQDEIEAFEMEAGININADIIEDKLMDDLIEHLNLNRSMDIPVWDVPMSDHDFSKHLVGKTITFVRYLSKEEAQAMDWVSRPIVIQLDDGSCIWPSRDDEGNDGGSLFTTLTEVPVIGKIWTMADFLDATAASIVGSWIGSKILSSKGKRKHVSITLDLESDSNAALFIKVKSALSLKPRLLEIDLIGIGQISNDVGLAIWDLVETAKKGQLRVTTVPAPSAPWWQTQNTSEYSFFSSR
jgi:hypothetical protein